MEQLDAIRELVRNAQTDKALKALQPIVDALNDNDFENRLAMLQNQYRSAKRDKDMGMATTSETSIAFNKVNASLLNFLEDLPIEKDTITTMPPKPPTPPPSGTKKILFLASNPIDKGKLQLDREFGLIFSSLQGNQSCDLRSQFTTTSSNLQSELLKQKPQIVHFAGHGTASEASGIGYDASDTGIYVLNSRLEAKLIPIEVLENLFKIMAPVCKMELVILNACHSSEQAQAIGKHVQYVIGMSRAIPDETSAQFSKGFYEALADNQTDLELAFQLGRNNVWMDISSEDKDIMVLYKNGQKLMF